jgi:hypothetical protein
VQIWELARSATCIEELSFLAIIIEQIDLPKPAPAMIIEGPSPRSTHRMECSIAWWQQVVGT